MSYIKRDFFKLKDAFFDSFKREKLALEKSINVVNRCLRRILRVPM